MLLWHFDAFQSFPMPHFEFKPGVTYIVIKAFDDFDGGHFKKGERLTFVDYSFFAYDDGYTFNFRERGMRLRGVDTPSIVHHMEEYLRPLSTDDWSRDGVTLSDKVRDRTPRRLRKKK